MRKDMARQLSKMIALALRRAVRRRYALAVLVPALAAGLVVALLPGAHHSSGRAATPPAHAIRPAGALGGGLQPATTTAALEQAKRKPVTLLTGDQVRLTPAAGGRSVVTPASTKPTDNSLAYTFQVGGDVYSIPGAALPYVGRQLDPRFFDVSYLQRAGYANLKALPVSVSWRSSTHPTVPGITSPTSGSNTTGSVSMSDAPALGQALKNHASVLTQVKKISLGALPAAQGRFETLKPAPAVPMSSSSAPAGTKLYSLRVNTIDHDGKPSVGVVAIQNVKSLAQYYSVSAVGPDGTIAVSVPAGQYAVEAFMYDIGIGNFPENLAFVSADVDVSHDADVTLDSRQAKEITVSVPKPAVPAIETMTFNRTSADHFGLQAAMWMYGQGVSTVLPPTHMYARPRPAPKVGKLDFADAWDLVPVDSGLTGVDAPYSYSLDFASQNGVPGNLSRTLTDKDLATVHDNYASSIAGGNAVSTMAPFHTWSTLTLGLFPALLDFPVPTKRDDYFGGSTDTVWEQSTQPTTMIGPSPTPPPATWGPYRTFRPGETDNATWGASPAVPAPEWQTMGIPYTSTSADDGANKTTWSYVCPACRQGDLMAFNVVASGDNDPTHSENWLGVGAGLLTNTPGQATDSLKFYRNGALTQLAGRSGQMFPMLPGKADYSIDWDHTIPVAWTQLATDVHSVWKFSSSRPARADRVPSFELCAPDSNQACSYVPLVFANYDFGANLSGQVSAPGSETFTLTGYHQANESDAPPVTDAAVQVSYDDGTTWAPASSVSKLGGGKFRVSVNQPDPSATGGYASFKVTLTDSAGNSLEQTVLRAYALTAPASATHR